MPDVRSTLEFLARLPLYETEKPYLYLPGKDEGLDPNVTKLDNLEYEHHSGILIKDVRQHPELSFDDCGFEFQEFPSRYKQFETAADTDGYRAETEQILTKRFNAERVMVYDIRLRKNDTFGRSEFDVYDPLLIEGPAKGAHNGRANDSPFMRFETEGLLAACRRDIPFSPQYSEASPIKSRLQHVSPTRIPHSNPEVSFYTRLWDNLSHTDVRKYLASSE
ncbi:hypothetical protein A1O7_04850 [Cladophialophora yegresii CBS 114405]|uniref:Uncharacterized protein n=1 Tax=Cladophialophora yegresii CBS 114405 TaxID=1182544 RepID=W9VXY0_9EURO|nr:uncharacterized protein A1O7_04850 [Cladophialophora yegresii CBS 114405]EXJ60697.1 hypothetical protein A1O7_04850 [Cladophialophora yegresii CBS 114405]